MKNLKYILICLIIIACNNDDDTIPSEQSNVNFNFELNKEFLTSEKWFLNTIIAEKAIDYNEDGNSSNDILSQVQECDLDNYYTFDEKQEDKIILYDSDNICDNFFELYVEGQGIGFYEILSPTALDFNGNLLGNNKMFDSFGGFNVESLDNVKVGIANDNSFKIIQGEYNIIVNDERIEIIYSLIAKPEDRF